MDAKSGLPVVVVVAGVIILAGVSAAAFYDPLSDGGPLGVGTDEDPVEPAVTSFAATGAECVERTGSNSSTRLSGTQVNSRIVVARNVTVPGTNYTVEPATFERTGPSNYTLEVRTTATDEPGRRCTAEVRYNATVQVPHGQHEPFRVTITEDGSTAMWVHNGERSAGVGAAGSGGVAKSGGDGSTGETTTGDPTAGESASESAGESPTETTADDRTA